MDAMDSEREGALTLSEVFTPDTTLDLTSMPILWSEVLRCLKGKIYFMSTQILPCYLSCEWCTGALIGYALCLAQVAITLQYIVAILPTESMHCFFNQCLETAHMYICCHTAI